MGRADTTQPALPSLLPALRWQLTSTPDHHSPLAPPLPIPNRTVKRRRADDSTDCPCESRSLSGTHTTRRPDQPIGPFGVLRAAKSDDALRVFASHANV